MPNTGKPSLACHECRRRRVKCDLGRPGCLRCIKYEIVCPGYRDQSDLKFRHSNTDTIKKKVTDNQRRRGVGPLPRPVPDKRTYRVQNTQGIPSRSRLASPYQSDSTFDPGSSSSSSESEAEEITRATIKNTSVDLMRGPSHNWKDHSHRVVIECYPWVSVLEPLMHRVPKNSPLYLSTSMLARGYLVNRKMLMSPPIEEIEARGLCVTSVREALANPRLAVLDSTIMAVWLMGVYEVLMGWIKWPPGKEQNWLIHHVGLVSLINARGLDQFKTPSGRQIFWLCVETIQIHYNSIAQPCPPSILKWLHKIKGWNLAPMEVFAMKSAFLSAQFSDLYPTIGQAIYSNDENFAASVIGHIIAQVEVLESEYKGYEDLIQKMRIQEIARGRYKCPVARLKMYHWLYYAINLALQSDNLPVEWPRPRLVARHHECLMKIQDIAEDILDTAPPTAARTPTTRRVSASWSKNMGMMYPFAAICHMQTPTMSQRLRARDVLRFIGNVCGIRQALKPGMRTAMPEKASRGIPYEEIIVEEGVMM